MDLQPILSQVLTKPSPEALWDLYGQLLEIGLTGEDTSVRIVETFHHYLCDLQSKATAQQFSELASKLDIGAVGGVAIENLMGGEGEELLKRFFLGAASESLMVLASRQYIKGWQAELHSSHCQAAWFLAGELWRISTGTRPDLPAGKRWNEIQTLFQPVMDPETPDVIKATLLGYIFQLLLFIELLPLVLVE
ncbi:MAG: hypothetical protein JXA42_09090 [Anaerolineales bacterium]|nr:hypothetical protein [Anaerolineales bacterium]